MVYGIRKECRGGSLCCAKVVHAIVLQSCEQCRWARHYLDDGLVQESFGVNESRVQGGPIPRHISG